MIKDIQAVAIKRNGKWEGGLSINNGSVLIGSTGHRISTQVEDVKSYTEAYKFSPVNKLAKQLNSGKPTYGETAEGQITFGTVVDDSMIQPTASQRKFAEDLIRTHKLDLSVTSYDDAASIIEVYKNKITPNQRKHIEKIRNATGCLFLGSTKSDATRYIEMYKDTYKPTNVPDEMTTVYVLYDPSVSSIHGTIDPIAVAFDKSLINMYLGLSNTKAERLVITSFTSCVTTQSIQEDYPGKLLNYDKSTGILFFS